MAEAKEKMIDETTAEAKEKMVKVYIPFERGANGDVYVSVNNRSWLIQRGVEVEIPECAAEVLRESERAREEAWKFEQSVQNG